MQGKMLLWFMHTTFLIERFPSALATARDCKDNQLQPDEANAGCLYVSTGQMVKRRRFEQLNDRYEYMKKKMLYTGRKME
jgi:hypothetical protein